MVYFWIRAYQVIWNNNEIMWLQHVFFLQLSTKPYRCFFSFAINSTRFPFFLSHSLPSFYFLRTCTSFLPIIILLLSSYCSFPPLSISSPSYSTSFFLHSTFITAIFFSSPTNRHHFSYPPTLTNHHPSTWKSRLN